MENMKAITKLKITKWSLMGFIKSDILNVNAIISFSVSISFLINKYSECWPQEENKAKDQ